MGLGRGMLPAVLALVLLIGGYLARPPEVAYTTDNLVRLHVLAHDDSSEEQALKLQVRDAILQEGRITLTKALTKQEALRTLLRERLRLEEVARKRMGEAGCSHPVKVELERKAFPECHYRDLYVPAGVYDSLTVTIGEGKGANWWCVMFPPLCLTEPEEEIQPVPALPPSPANLRPRFVTLEWVRDLLPNWAHAIGQGPASNN